MFIVPKNVQNRLAKLPAELRITRYESHQNCDEIFVEITNPTVQPCPHCGSEHTVIKDQGRMRTVRHLSYGGQGLLITFHHRRYVCRDCRRSFQEPVYWILDRTRITVSLYLDICRELQTTSSIKDIALRNAVTPAIVNHVLEEIPFGPPSFLPSTLCIDEFSGSAGYWDKVNYRWVVTDYHCNLADGDNGCVIDVLPSPNKDFLLEYFYAFNPMERKNVRFFCCDMRSGFLTLAKTVFPGVTICIDPFHVVKLLSDNVTSIRRALQREYRISGDDTTYKLLRGSARLLTTSEYNQGVYWSGKRIEENKERLDSVLALSDELSDAYQAYQQMIHIVHMSSYQQQRLFLGDWLGTFSGSPYESVKHCANTVRHNKSYILNAFHYGKSNAVCEGLNNKIKILKKCGYGAHKFENFRKRILLACDPYKQVVENYTVFAEKATTEKEAMS